MADQIAGTKILSVRGVGTSDGDEVAFVQCELHDGSIQAIAFAPEISTPVCSAFLGAAGHIQKKRSMRGLSTDPLLVDLHSVKMSLAQASDKGLVVILDMATKSGVELNFRLDVALARSLVAKLANLLNAKSN